MTDSLRTRIAKVLYQSFALAMGFGDAEWENVEQESWLEDADAVIREINLAKACGDSGCVWQIPNRFEDMTDKQQELLEREEDE